MELALTPGGERTPSADRALAQQVVDAAEHLQHLAALAIVAAGGEDPDVGAAHLLDGLDELAPRLEDLRRAQATARAS